MDEKSRMLPIEEVRELLEDIFSGDIAGAKIVLSDAGEKGDGFMSFMTKADVNDTHHYIIKWAPRTEQFRKLTPTRLNFVREIYFYRTVFPILRKFQEERNVLKLFNSVPRCFKTNDKDMHELILMENLVERGYSMWNRKVPMNHAHITLVLHEYGKLHATSFAMRDQNEKLLYSLAENLGSFFEGTTINKVFVNAVTVATERLMGLVSDSGLCEALAKFKDDINGFLDFLGKPGPYDVILHGDAWNNNFLFKHQEDCGPEVPLSVRFLDFQAARTGSQFADIAYFFYTSASKEKLHKHKAYLMKYYMSFCEHLKALGSDPEKMFPMDIFMAEWKKNARFGLVTALVLFNIMLREKDEVIDVADVGKKPVSFDDVLVNTGKNEDIINQRLLDLAQHLYDNGYL